MENTYDEETEDDAGHTDVIIWQDFLYPATRVGETWWETPPKKSYGYDERIAEWRNSQLHLQEEETSKPAKKKKKSRKV